MRVIRRVLTAWLVVLLAGEAAAQAPIKIGFISPLSGAIAAAGKDMKLEVILEDNEGQPGAALTRARKLVENDKLAASTSRSRTTAVK